MKSLIIKHKKYRWVIILIVLALILLAVAAGCLEKINAPSPNTSGEQTASISQQTY